MKKIRPVLSGFAIIAATVVSSCSKNLKDGTFAAGTTASSVPKVTPLSVPNDKINITMQSDGNYISGYGGGIRFGTNLPHPTTPDPSGAHDGEAGAEIQYVNWSLNPDDVYSTYSGGYFDILEPTFPGAVTIDQVHTYFNKLAVYYAGTGDRPAPIGSTTGSGGIKEVSGLIIRDHTSPTLMSIVADSYKPVVSTGAANVLIGDTFRGSYDFDFYVRTLYAGNTVDRVQVLLNNADVTSTTLKSYALTQTVSADHSHFHVVGSITLKNGTVYSIDDDVWP